MSSPGFWAEAAKVPIPPVKRLRTTSPLLEVKDEDKAVPPSPEERSDTALKYLPNRLDLFDEDNPHAYLANPEYAPNRFGDIGDYMRKKEIKVQTQNRDIALASALEGTPQIFKDLSFYINGNTQPPMEELRKMILQRGGEVRPVLRNKGMVKFIIAPMLTQMKFKQFANYKVVREGWITESCKQEKLLDWSKWKLQVQGGWEESSRKGMAGFLAGTQTQAPRDEPESEDEEDAAMKEEVTKAKARAAQATPAAPAIAIASSSSLLRPMSRPTPSIPISPGATKAATPQKEHVPSYVQRPEGGFYDVSYYSKDSNDDAARLLKDQEWRLKNTAERGNEGGFIDGYYQNSR
jgi:DNA repair protein REV1